MQPGHFVEEGFEVPDSLETNEYRLRMLTIHDVVKDYDAVMSSVETIKTTRRESDWPDGLTIEDNLIDLGWHHREFLTRRSFAYTVVTLDELQIIGCVYIYPTRKVGHDAEIYSWARASKLGSKSDTALYKVVKAWVERDWPFKNPAYPGRSVEWKVWEDTPEQAL